MGACKSGMADLTARKRNIRKHDRTPHKRFSKIISLSAKNLEGVLLAEPRFPVMLSCQTLTRSAKVCGQALQTAQPKALDLEKDHLAEPWNVGSFRLCPQQAEPSKMMSLPFVPFELWGR